MTTLRIVDDNGVTWLWDGGWLDIEYNDSDPDDAEGSGYRAETFDEVVHLLQSGGFIEASDDKK